MPQKQQSKASFMLWGSLIPKTVKFITVDIESTGLNPYKDELTLIGYRINGEGDTKWVNVDKGETDEQLRDLLYDESIVVRGHNIKFDAMFLSQNGYPVRGDFDDTRVCAYLANPFENLDLKSVCRSYLGKDHVGFGELWLKKKELKEGIEYIKIKNKYVKRSDLLAKNKEDVELCDELREHLHSTKWYKEVERPLIRHIYDMEVRGSKLDVVLLTQLKATFSVRVMKLKLQLEKQFGIENVNSPDQLSEAIAKDFPLSQYATKGKKGKYSTGSLFIKRMVWDGHEELRELLYYRKMSKLLSTYINPFSSNKDRENKIHAQFNQAGRESSSGDVKGTATGRLSSSGPNLQNIPVRTEEGKEIRKLFIPSRGMKMFDTDLKQIEPRFVAHYTQSPKLVKAYQEGLDTHGMFAADIFEKDIKKLSPVERFIGKTSWLATVYGCSAKMLIDIVDRNSDEPVPYDLDFYQMVQDNFWRANPEIQTWRRCQIETTRRCGYITTYSGRVIKIDGLNSRNRYERFSAERKAVNYPIQASAAEVMKMILLRFYEQFTQDNLGYVLATVHDEILGEYRDDISDKKITGLIDNIMTNTCHLKNVPIEADTKLIKNWGEAK